MLGNPLLEESQSMEHQASGTAEDKDQEEDGGTASAATSATTATTATTAYGTEDSRMTINTEVGLSETILIEEDEEGLSVSDKTVEIVIANIYEFTVILIMIAVLSNLMK